MARLITIEITGQAGQYEAMVKRIQEVNKQLVQTSTAGVQQQVQTFTQTYGTISNLTSGVTLKQRELSSAISLVASQVGGLGQVAGLASNAIVAMATSSGTTAVALGALAAVMGFLIYRIDQAKERLRDLAETELAAFARETKALGIEDDLKRRIAILKSAKPEIEAVRQEFDKIRIELEKTGARPQALAAVDRAKELEIQKIRIEQTKKETEETDKLRQSLVDQADALNAQLIALELGAEAADQFKINNLLASEAVKKLGAAGIDAVQAIASLLAGIRRYNEIVAQRKEAIDLLKREIDAQTEAEKNLAEALAGTARDNEILKQQALTEIDIRKQLRDLEADRLEMSGKTKEAEALRLKARIEELQALRAEESKITFDTRLRDAQIANAQAALKKVGDVTIDVGAHVARTLDDLFSSLISGTLKGIDVGKAALSTVGRIAADIFKQAITDKLKFELTLFNNIKQVPAAANAAATSGSTGGGIFQTILFGKDGASGLIGSLKKVWSSIFGTTSTTGTTPAGTAAAISPIAAAAAAAACTCVDQATQGPQISEELTQAVVSIERLRDNLTQASVTIQRAGDDFSADKPGIDKNIAALNLGSILSVIGTTISSAIDIVTGTETAVDAAVVAAEAAAQTAAQAASTAGSTILNSISWIPYIGWAIAAITTIYRIIANQAERPNARLSGQFGGVAFDETMQQFVAGDINVGIGRKVGIKNSVAGQIATNLQQRLLILANQWTDILNIFPDMISNDIIPALELTNQRLNQNFKNIKFSPGGSRSIQQELEAMSGPDGLVRFFHAFQPALGAGFWGSLVRAGVGSIDTSGFQAISPGFKFPQADWDKFIASIKDVAGITGRLAQVGASKFLSPKDIEGVSGIFGQLFATTDATQFTKLAGALTEQLKPISDFLDESVKAASELFGRGLMAALEAATESDAQLAFLNSLNTGVKDMVFQGITGAFIASAQYADLLAPIQKVIREFTQEALATGIPPDIAAFRSAILPAIEEISTRATTLQPLVAALQALGFEIKGILGLNPLPVVEPEKVVEPVVNGLTESAQLFGQSLMAAMDAASSSEAMDSFMEAFNTGIKQAVFSGLIDTFLATGLVDQLLAPIQAALKKMIEDSQTTGQFIIDPNAIILLIQQAQAAAAGWEPFIQVLRDMGFAINATLGLNQPPPPPPPEPPPPPSNIVINLNGVGAVDQESIPELARRINYMLEPNLAPRA